MLTARVVKTVEGSAGFHSVPVTLKLRSAQRRALSVQYETIDGSASVADGDYRPESGTLAIPAGATTAAFNVVINGDLTIESEEQFTVKLTELAPGVTGLTAGPEAIVTVALLDDDETPATFWLCAPPHVAEGGLGAASPMIFVAGLSAPRVGAVTANIAVTGGTASAADGDYTATPQALVFAPGEVQKQFVVTVHGDALDEADETVVVVLTNVAGNVTLPTAWAMSRILDDDVPPPSGDVVIVWGGWQPVPGNETLNNGAVYDPASDSWSQPPGLNSPPISSRFQHTAVWTGTHMIVWGGWREGVGRLGDGALYHAATDSWTAPPGLSSGPLGARTGHSAVWTGTHMVVWGGGGPAGFHKDGAAYDPVTDTWTVTPGLSAAACPFPIGRTGAATAWTGGKMIVWGGYNNGWPRDGALYDPATDMWETPSGLSNDSERPSVFRYAGAVCCSGAEFYVMGGSNGMTPFSTGAIYDIANDSWRQAPDLAQSPLGGGRSLPACAWAGSRVFIWGGTWGDDYWEVADDGAIHDPALGAWAAAPGLNGAGRPTARESATAVWTGS